jgi:hypothetical protein
MQSGIAAKARFVLSARFAAVVQLVLFIPWLLLHFFFCVELTQLLSHRIAHWQLALRVVLSLNPFASSLHAGFQLRAWMTRHARQAQAPVPFAPWLEIAKSTEAMSPESNGTYSESGVFQTRSF